MACAFPSTPEHISPGRMSSPSTTAYLRSGELTSPLPATTQVLSQFRFISKDSDDAATTAARIRSPRPFPAVISRGARIQYVVAVLCAALCSPVASPVPRTYTSVSAVRASASASRTARAASASEAPVVIRSSTRTTGASASSHPPPPVTSSAPARLASRCRELSPDWSATDRRCRSTAATRAAVPHRRSSPAAASAIRRVGSCPLARTARRDEGTGTSSTAPRPPPLPDAPDLPSAHRAPRPAPRDTAPASIAARPASGPIATRPARTAPASAVPSGPASVRTPRSLCARSAARTAPPYAAAACTTGSPTGSGTGRTRRGARPWRAARHSGQSTVRGLPQPPHSAGSTRSVRSCHHLRMTPLCQRPRGPARPVENSRLSLWTTSDGRG
jgi:hypothetical protein